MIVYGHRSFELEPQRFLVELRKRILSGGDHPDHDAIVEWLVDIGEAEAAVADALMRDVDSDAPDLSGWHAIADAIAEAACASHYGDARAVSASVYRTRDRIEHLLREPVPAVVHARMAEGFACYSLYPEQYMSAADHIVAEMRPHSVFCLGLRSIGGILAHVVASTFKRQGVASVVRSARPRGHPFDRHLRFDDAMARLVAGSECDLYAVVDEGPGLSGSSFAAAAEQLIHLGIAPERIVLMPAWNADPDRLNSARGARTWRAHRRFVGHYDPFDRRREAIDLSAGRWRDRVFGKAGENWPAVQPQHERPKFLDEGGGRIARFAGLGRTGSRRLRRAELLHDEGFGPAVRDLRDGVLQLEWVEGQPVRSASATFLSDAARYLAVVTSSFATDLSDDPGELASMIETNAREAGIALDMDMLEIPVSTVARRVAVDGRMMLHEWVDTASGIRKVDALDHHDDDFFPGCRDIAWDVAGMCVEADLDPHATQYFVGKYRDITGDSDIGRRLPFYEAAYSAFRLGYSRMASESVADTAEARRFRQMELMYADRLRRFQRSA